MIKLIILGAVLWRFIRHIEKYGADKLALILCFIEIGLFFDCIGMI